MLKYYNTMTLASLQVLGWVVLGLFQTRYSISKQLGNSFYFLRQSCYILPQLTLNSPQTQVAERIGIPQHQVW